LFEVAGLGFSITQLPESLVGALDNYCSLCHPVFTSALGHEQVRFEEGTVAVARDGDEIVVRSTPADLTAGLRGMLVSALDPRGGGLLHGAGVVLDGQAILCVAPSEGGKTTLCGKIAGRVPVLSDETVALWLEETAPKLAGTFFWSGAPLLTAAGNFPLAAICFLEKGGVGLASIERSEALRALLLEWHLPERPGGAADTLARAERLLARVRSFRLRTDLDTDPFPLLMQARKG
jgi:hypothetical protein